MLSFLLTFAALSLSIPSSATKTGRFELLCTGLRQAPTLESSFSAGSAQRYFGLSSIQPVQNDFHIKLTATATGLTDLAASIGLLFSDGAIAGAAVSLPATSDGADVCAMYYDMSGDYVDDKVIRAGVMVPYGSSFSVDGGKCYVVYSSCQSDTI